MIQGELAIEASTARGLILPPQLRPDPTARERMALDQLKFLAQAPELDFVKSQVACLPTPMEILSEISPCV